jgi:cytochrome c-type biogenesis protein CcmF
VTTQYGVEKDIKMSLNETVEIKGYAFTFKGVSALQGANYTGNKDGNDNGQFNLTSNSLSASSLNTTSNSKSNSTCW